MAYCIETVQKIPATLDEVWELFSNPVNLERITPKGMGFRVISKPPEGPVFIGQIIEYKVSPIAGIPLYWKTEITEVRAKEFFVDEQRKGPYNLWRHQHFFREIEGGVEMKDIVHYKNPFGIIGRLANSLLVRNKLRKIFLYRYNTVEQLFGKWENQLPGIDIR